MATTTINNSGYRTFQATAVAIEAYARVKVDSDGLISVAGASDPGIGWTQEAVEASGYGTVKLNASPGTQTVQAAAAITRGAVLYAAADGEVDDAGIYKLGLVALEAATAQGDTIEVVPQSAAAAAIYAWASANIGTVVAAGSDQTDATAITKNLTYVSGADGATGVILPTACAGLTYVVYNVAASALLLYPNTDDDINDGTTDAAVSMTAKTAALCTAVDDTTWAVIYS